MQINSKLNEKNRMITFSSGVCNKITRLVSMYSKKCMTLNFFIDFLTHQRITVTQLNQILLLKLKLKNTKRERQ